MTPNSRRGMAGRRGELSRRRALKLLEGFYNNFRKVSIAMLARTQKP